VVEFRFNVWALLSCYADVGHPACEPPRGGIQLVGMDQLHADSSRGN
jgi:hypothetical protein